MFLTVPLLSKSTFLGSLVNKIRQVTKIKRKERVDKHIQINNNNFTNTINKLPQTDAHKTVDNFRPTAVANISLSTPTSKTYEEKVGLPPRPKKPLTPYFRFLKDERPKLAAANPSTHPSEITRMASKLWKDVDQSLKDRLQVEYKRDQQQYVERRAKYDAKVPDEKLAEIKQLKQDVAESRERRVLRKRVRQLERPKRPASAFLRYLAKERTLAPQLPEQTYREWQMQCSTKWSKLPVGEKETYFEQSKKALETYQRDLLAWEQKMARMGNMDLIRSSQLVDPPERKTKK